ncbi:hypothetical protein MPSEU_000244100 [Mayamaea pseudoterrestris]|nr:hypothetical protein MPSEU_000244100 [Mayamaea pseudoterrestris]
MKELTIPSPESEPLMEETSGDLSHGSEESEESVIDVSLDSPPLSRKLFPTPEKEQPQRLRVDLSTSRLYAPRIIKKSPSLTGSNQYKRPSSLKQPVMSTPRYQHLRPRLPPEETTDAEGFPVRAKCTPQPTEVPPESSCHGGLTLTPNQLTDLFNLFDDARREWPLIFRSAAETPLSATDESTCVAGNLSSEHAIPNELQTPQNHARPENGVINVESMSAMKLQSEIAILRENTIRIMVEMKRIQGELETVSRERELLKERESTHKEAIKALEQALEEARASSSSTTSDVTHSELEQLRAENELFASQIIENEVEMREIRTILGFMDKENELMRLTLEALESQNAKEKAGESSDLVAQIETLTGRILEMERNRVLDREMFQGQDAAQLRGKGSLLSHPIIVNGSMMSESCTETVDEFVEEGIEVTIQGPVTMMNKIDDEADSIMCCSCCPP